jgi:hypothetical protein
MDTLTEVAEKRLTQARDLRPGDIISQEYLDRDKGSERWTVRQVRLDRVLSSYLAYVQDGQTYLVPVVLLHGWDLRRGMAVRVATTAQRPWETQRISR